MRTLPLHTRRHDGASEINKKERSTPLRIYGSTVLIYKSKLAMPSRVRGALPLVADSDSILRLMVSDIKTLFDAGAHFALPRARRHPSAAPFLFGTKDRTDIFNLEETERRLEAACAFVRSLAGKHMLFGGGKNEGAGLVKSVGLA